MNSAAPSAHRLRALHEAVLTIGAQVGVAPETIAALVTGVVARAVEVLGASGGVIALAEHPVWSGLVPGTTADDGHIMLRDTGEAERRLHRPGGTALRALEGHPTDVADTASPEHGGAYDWLVASGVRSFTIVPMWAGSDVIGALVVNFPAPGVLPEADRQLLDLFAAHAGVALERARRAYDEQRRAALDAALMVARTVAHEINNALSPICGYAELLSLSPTVAADATLRGHAQRISLASSEVAEMVRRLQRIIRVEPLETALGPDRPLLDLDRSTTPA